MNNELGYPRLRPQKLLEQNTTYTDIFHVHRDSPYGFTGRLKTLNRDIPNNDLHSLYVSPNIITVIVSRKISWWDM